MLKLLISGCNGRMGRAVEEVCASEPEITITGGIDLLGPGEREFPIVSSPAGFRGEADVLVDFSAPAALEGLLEWGQTRRVPLVLCTTGYRPVQQEAIAQMARRIPIFRSANMSLGVNVLLDLVRRAAAVLGGDFDIEIVERHHSKKLDAPSGTALMLAGAAAEALPCPPSYVYERQSTRKSRDRREIGISSVRGGGIVGDHEVLFAGRNEVIELRHSALSREVFASGAVQAARFLTGVSEPGLYTMSDLVEWLGGPRASV